MTRETGETTYEQLFERYLARIVRLLMVARFGSPDSGREGLFEQFLEGNVFICSACGVEFTPTDAKETELVRCERCKE
jgi:hypothetical protein